MQHFFERSLETMPISRVCFCEHASKILARCMNQGISKLFSSIPGNRLLSFFQMTPQAAPTTSLNFICSSERKRHTFSLFVKIKTNRWIILADASAFIKSPMLCSSTSSDRFSVPCNVICWKNSRQFPAASKTKWRIPRCAQRHTNIWLTWS